jgi:hypothetical protein
MQTEILPNAEIDNMLEHNIYDIRQRIENQKERPSNHPLLHHLALQPLQSLFNQHGRKTDRQAGRQSNEQQKQQSQDLF